MFVQVLSSKGIGRVMNNSNNSAADSAFPAAFVVLSTFIGLLVWLFVMLAGLPQY